MIKKDLFSAKKLQELFRGNTNIVSCGILFIVIIVYLFTFLFPGIKSFCSTLKDASQLKAEIQRTEQDWANSVLYGQRITELNKKIEFYEKKLPGEKEIPSILQYLSDAAKKLDVKIIEIRPIEQKIDKNQKDMIYYSVPILFNAECGYHQLGRFLNELEQADRFMKISDIKIKGISKTPGIHSVQLIIATYVMIQG